VPAVSIVLATYNQADWLGHAIESVRQQTLADWELLIVDDGSTDGTRDVVARWRDDSRVRYVPQTHAERSVARNRGIAAASAPLVAFLDADDCWRPAKLARQVAALAADPAAGLCYTVARFIDEAGRPLAIRKPPRPIAGDVFASLMRANLLILSSVMVRAAALDAVGAFEPTRTACEDWDLWLRIARRYPVVGVDDELTLYRKHAGNTAWERVLDGALAVIDEQYADPDTERRTGLPREAVRALQYWVNAATLAMERRSAALPLVARALREFPKAAWSRSALATFATLLLPATAVRTMRRLAP